MNWHLSEDKDWQAQLRRIATTCGFWPCATPMSSPCWSRGHSPRRWALRPLGILRPLEQILSLLIYAGFAAADALHMYRAYYGFLYGHILNALQELIVDADENEALLRLGLHRLPSREFPRLRALAPVLADYDGAAELDQGISILLSSV